jgi:hypothetical protein
MVGMLILCYEVLIWLHRRIGLSSVGEKQKKAKCMTFALGPGLLVSPLRAI